MYQFKTTNRFEKDLKKAVKSGKDVEKIKIIMKNIIDGKTLPQNFIDHKLEGNYTGYRECHIEPDWLLIYKIDKKAMEVVFVRTGTHSELF